MRSNPGALSKQLDSGLAPFYYLFGPEPLLVEETLDQIRTVARKTGYGERIRFTAEKGFDWDQLFHFGQAMSLFVEKKVIELRIPTGKPGDAGTKALMEYAANQMSEDVVLVVISGNIEKRTQQTKWFKAVEQATTVVECPAIPADRLPDWVSRRMSSRGLSFDGEAVEQLCLFVEGNLLAASQEINLLALLYPDTRVTAEIVEQTIADHARFNVFILADACVAGSVNRVIRILHSLKNEQTEPILVLWALTRNVRLLCQLSAGIENGVRADSLFQKHRIWSSKERIFKSALQRLARPQWERLLQRTGRADLMLKGARPLQRKDIWEELESIALSMCKPDRKQVTPVSH